MSESSASNWRMVTLNEIGEVNRGRSRVRPRNAPHLYGSKYPFIQTGDITASLGRISSHTQSYSEAGLAQSRLWPAGTMCITIAANIAETGILQFPACFPDSVVGFLPDAKIADVRFVEYMFRQLKRTIQLEATGSVQDNINLATLGRLRFPLPDIREQRVIAEVLGALDDKIAANTKLVGVVDELAEAFTRTSIDPDLPVQLSRIADVTMGSSPIGASLNEDGRGTVFFQGVRDFGFRFPKRRIWTEQVTRLAEASDTLLSVRAPVGRVNIASEPICIGRGLASARTRVGEPSTLFNLLKAFPEIWEPFEAEGTIFGSINRAQLEGIEVPRVRPELASELEARLVGLESSIKSALAENDFLAVMRDTLLPELMSGRLRVKDAETKIEEVV